MKKLKLLFTLLLLCAGVCAAWSQTFTKGSQVTSLSQLSTDKLYFIEHTYMDNGSTSYGYLYLNGQKSGTTEWYLNYNSSLPASDNKYYVWRLVDSATPGRYYLQNMGNKDCYILQTDSWQPSYAGTGTKGDFEITEAGQDNKFKFHCTNGSGIYKYIGGMGGADYGNGINGVCGDDGDKHWERIYVAVPDYSVSTAAQGNISRPEDGLRRTEHITLTARDREDQRIGGLQTTYTSPVYFDLTGTTEYKKKFYCYPGERIQMTSDIDHEVKAMQCFVYIDEDGDGFSYEVDEVNKRAKPGSDLKAWGGYTFGAAGGVDSNWIDSNGDPATATDSKWRAYLTTPEFTAPTRVGTYRLRYKVEWNNIDPRASSGIDTDGGIIVDALLVVEEKSATSYAKTSNVSSSDNTRIIEEIYLTCSNTRKQTVSGCQSTSNRALYIDKTSTVLTCKPGELLKADVKNGGAWNHLYVYIDEGDDGFGHKLDATTHCPVEGSDLKTFTYYNTRNSLGKSMADGNVSIHSAPAFYAPKRPGTYRVRYKTDWNCIDPKGDYGDGTGASSGSNNILKNRGCIIDFTLRVEEVPDANTVTYVDENNTPLSVMAEVSQGYSCITADGNVLSPDVAVTRFIGIDDYLVRDFVSATVDGVTYYSWDELTAAVAGNANVTVKLASKVQPGKFFAIKHAGNTSRYIYDTGSELNALAKKPIDNSRYIFTVEDAGNGKWHLRNALTTRRVKRTGANGIINDQSIPTKSSPEGDDCDYYITNALVANRTDIYGIVDGTDVSNPVTGISQQRYLHCNNGNKVVRWSTQNTAGNNSQWYLEEIPVVRLVFKDADGNELDGVSYRATNSSDLMPYAKALASFKGISFDNYSVLKYELNGQEYTTRTNFFAAVHALRADGEAVFTLRPKAEGEVDLTLQLWKTKGNGYTDEACTEGEFAWAGNAAGTAAKKAWRLNVGTGEQDIKGAVIPTDIDLRIISKTIAEGVGGQIVSDSGNGVYKYGMVPGGDNCICFTAGTGEGNTYEFQVADGYYILQYNLGLLSATVDQTLTFTNPGGATVTTDNPGQNAQRYTITDTPAARTCTFTAKAKVADQNKDCAANYFRVRIVNRTYLENSMERGYAICSDALKVGVGYPKESTEQYQQLQAAIDDFDADNSLDNYIAMLQAYSKYISCTDLNMPEDCKVYTLSFIKNDETRVLISNGDDGLELVEYNAENLAKPGARWISHENGNHKMVFVSKKDGRYLQALTATDGTGLSETYDEGTTSFSVRAVYQDMNDYMASTTDERLLGAVCMKSAQRPTSEEACKLTMSNTGRTWATSTQAYFNEEYTSAMLIEIVDGGNTYNNVTFRKAPDNKYYATYYSFYPVENPDGATMYYVTGEEDGYLKLQPVQEDVIRPCFPVILISDNSVLHGDDTEGHPTHLHIGEYTADKKDNIESLLSENGDNMLKGTVEDNVATSSEAGQVYVLSGNASGVGFFKYTGENLPVGKAYYVATTAGIRGFLFNFNGVATKIDISPAQDNGAAIYDLGGRRVGDATNGLLIIDGKKIMNGGRD